ncbi:hypothetical protein BDQ17DRAFT_1430659 [Cyathus striatus]|nr:hypothetical protein BDQ17DRAFT_1430659 [Cyathus striatus]
MSDPFLLQIPKTFSSNPKFNFHIPPLDGSLTVPQIYDWHLEHNADYPFFTFYSEGQHTTLAYSSVVPAMHRAAKLASSFDRNDNARPIETIAILSSSDTVSYFSTMVGIMQLGVPVFPISPRNSAPAIAKLLELTHVSHILVGTEPVLQKLIADVVNLTRNHHRLKDLRIGDMFSYDQLFTKVEKEDWNPVTPLTHNSSTDYHSPLIYVHSSGSSSSMPKAMKWTHASLLQVAITPYFGAYDLRGEIFGMHHIPMPHAIGLNYLAWATSGIILATFPPDNTPRIPNPQIVLEAFRDCEVAFSICPPTFLETWSKDQNAIQQLTKLKGLVFGGAPLRKSAGDKLVQNCVKVISILGCSEGGVIASMLTEFQGMDWEYMSINPHCNAKFIPEGNELYHMILVRQPTHVLYVINAKHEGQDAYATGDLYSPHPTKPGFWKVHGRADDQITLSTGKKVNPKSLENGLKEHPLVQMAVVFGTGQTRIGIIISPETSLKDDGDVSNLIDSIWPKIEEYNTVSSTYAKLFKEMIILTTLDKPIPTTDKGTIKRNQLLALYEKEIQDAYSEQNLGSQESDIVTPKDWTYQNCIEFLKELINKMLPIPVKDETSNIFDYGCDSVLATRIRNSIVNAFRHTGLEKLVGFLPQNLLYQQPTFSSLANFVSAVAHSDGSSENLPSASVEQRKQYLEDLRRRLLSQISARYNGASKKSSEDVILVTGTTGGLGSHLLAALASSEEVSRVYALNRLSKTSLLLRQQAALARQGLDPGVATSSKVVLLESGLSKDALGLDKDVLEEILSSVTHVLHTAWQVDFNLPCESFGADLAGVVSLINLCLNSRLESPPKLLFVSSIGIFQGGNNHEAIAEEPSTDPSQAVGMGYSESKWVAESILTAVSQTTPLHPIIFRLGQLAGPPKGPWKTSEWVPSLVKSSMTLGWLPEAPGVASWIPVDIASSSLIEMRNADAPIVHLVHPKPIAFNSIMGEFGKILGLHSCAYSEWKSKLVDLTKEGSISDTMMSDVPALKLLDFFVHLEDKVEGDEVFGLPTLSTKVSTGFRGVLGSARLFRPGMLRVGLGSGRRLDFCFSLIEIVYM